MTLLFELSGRDHDRLGINDALVSELGMNGGAAVFAGSLWA